MNQIRIHAAKARQNCGAAFGQGLLTHMSSLKAFALRLTHDPTRADDLVQDTLLKAIRRADSYRRDENQRAWLFTIMKNTFLSEKRRSWREAGLDAAPEPQATGGAPAQESFIELKEADSAIHALPKKQREALILVGAREYSYEEAAARCGCAVGTIKSRVSRARAQLEATA